MDKYIEALRATGLEATARGIAQVSRRQVLDAMESDAEFAEAVKDAMAKWADKLEEEAYRRGVTGIEKGIYYQGVKTDTEMQYSDTLLVTMLKAKRGDEYGDKRQITGANGEPLTVNIRTFAPTGELLSTARPSRALPTPILDAVFHEITADDLA